MFEALEVAIELVAAVRLPLEEVARRDGDLANQARRAATSVALCVSEGRERQGKDRLHLFRIASGSAAELSTALRLSVALGYLKPSSVQPAFELLDRELAMLWRLRQPKVA